jgi:putative FmdB family regulatory protein
MPLFEYLCESCGRTLEAIQGVGEPPLSLCDRCGGPLKKLLSAPAVQFKGTGWHVSDYPKAGASAPKTGEGAGVDGSKTEAAAPKEPPKSPPKSDTPKEAS